MGLLSRYLKCTRAAHLGAAEHLLHFVKGRENCSLVYGTDTGCKVFADASYRRGPDVSSATGYVVSIATASFLKMKQNVFLDTLIQKIFF